jgi:hypothetical protein
MATREHRTGYKLAILQCFMTCYGVHHRAGSAIPWRTSSPPLAPAKAFSRSGCGRIFPLFSRVMRAGLSTDLSPKRLGNALQSHVSLRLMTGAER